MTNIIVSREEILDRLGEIREKRAVMHEKRAVILKEEAELIEEEAGWIAALKELGRITVPQPLTTTTDASAKTATEGETDEQTNHASKPDGAVNGATKEAGPLHVAPNREEEDSLPHDLESLDLESIECLLERKNCTKRELSEIGFKRFGISRSRIARLRKDDALMLIRAVIENTRLHEVIYKQAAKGPYGKSKARRSSTNVPTPHLDLDDEPVNGKRRDRNRGAQGKRN